MIFPTEAALIEKTIHETIKRLFTILPNNLIEPPVEEATEDLPDAQPLSFPIDLESQPEDLEEVISIKEKDVTTLVNTLTFFTNLLNLSYEYGLLQIFRESRNGDLELSGSIPERIQTIETYLENQAKNIIDIDCAYRELPCLSLPFHKFQKLETLTISKTGISWIPQDISALTKLQLLNLGGNSLSKVPLGLSPLIHLETLYLNDNQITRVPKKSLPQNLQLLDVSKNPLSTIEEDLGCLTQLCKLNLCNTQLYELDAKTGTLPKLKELCISRTNLLQLPVTNKSCPNLKKIRVFPNKKDYSDHIVCSLQETDPEEELFFSGENSSFFCTFPSVELSSSTESQETPQNIPFNSLKKLTLDKSLFDRLPKEISERPGLEIFYTN